MKFGVLLDSGPLGLVTNPQGNKLSDTCVEWIEGLLNRNIEVIIPEISDYEVRRELIRARKTAGIRRLDDFKITLTYLPISTEAMLQAARFWATARQGGYPTAHEHALDGDVILAAQASLLSTGSNTVVVATMNVKHLTRFVDAKPWQEITFSDEDESYAH